MTLIQLLFGELFIAIAVKWMKEAETNNSAVHRPENDRRRRFRIKWNYDCLIIEHSAKHGS